MPPTAHWGRSHTRPTALSPPHPTDAHGHTVDGHPAGMGGGGAATLSMRGASCASQTMCSGSARHAGDLPPAADTARQTMYEQCTSCGGNKRRGGGGDLKEQVGGNAQVCCWMTAVSVHGAAGPTAAPRFLRSSALTCRVHSASSCHPSPQALPPLPHPPHRGLDRRGHVARYGQDDVTGKAALGRHRLQPACMRSTRPCSTRET